MRILRLISQKNFKFTPQNPNPNPQFLGFFLNKPYTTSAQSPDKIAAIADEITNLTLIEVSDLTTLLSKKLEIRDIPMVSLMMPGMGFSLRGIGGGGGGGGSGEKAVAEEKKEVKTVFDLKLEAGFEPGAKIKIIKELRTFTELGLKEAKELVEKAPAVLKTGLSKEDADKIVEKMKAIGATVVLE